MNDLTENHRRRSKDAAAAAQARDSLAAVLKRSTVVERIQLVDRKGRPHEIELPAAALRSLLEIPSELARGNGVSIVPLRSELTTQEAADLLKVSRPHLVKLLESGALPFHRTGKHRRIKLDELLRYKQNREAASEAALRALAAEAQALKMGYE